MANYTSAPGSELIHKMVAWNKAKMDQYMERTGMNWNQVTNQLMKAYGEDKNQAAVDALIDPVVDAEYSSAVGREMEKERKAFAATMKMERKEREAKKPQSKPKVMEPVANLELPEPTPVEVIEKSKGRSFLLAGQTFTEGDKLTIITPELGTLIAATKVQPFGANKVVGLELTPLLFVTNCSSKLSFYSNGQGYHTLQLAYHCSCGHNLHRRYMEWFGVEIDGNTIRAKEPARPEKPLKPLVLPPIKTEQLAVKPEVQPVIRPEPEVSADKKGQFLLF